MEGPNLKKQQKNDLTKRDIECLDELQEICQTAESEDLIEKVDTRLEEIDFEHQQIMDAINYVQNDLLSIEPPRGA